MTDLPLHNFRKPDHTLSQQIAQEAKIIKETAIRILPELLLQHNGQPFQDLIMSLILVLFLDPILLLNKVSDLGLNFILYTALLAHLMKYFQFPVLGLFILF